MTLVDPLRPKSSATNENEEAGQRISHELDTWFDDVVVGDVNAAAATPVLQVSIKQLGEGKAEPPAPAPPRDEPPGPPPPIATDDRGLTVQGMYIAMPGEPAPWSPEGPVESMDAVVPLTKLKGPVGEPAPGYLDEMDEMDEIPDRRRRPGVVYLAVGVVIVICVFGGLAAAYVLFSGQDGAAGGAVNGPAPATVDAGVDSGLAAAKVLTGGRSDAAVTHAGGDAAPTSAADADTPPPPVAPISDGAPPLQDLPDESVLPITFEPGGYEEVQVDEAALERIVAVMLAQPALRFEVVGFTTPTECASVEESQFVSARRARKAVRVIRTYGPTGRRFLARGARPEEVPPGREVRPIVVLKVLNRQ